MATACAHAPAQAPPRPASPVAKAFDLDAFCKAGGCLRREPPSPRTLGLARQVVALERQDRTTDDSVRAAGSLSKKLLPVPPGMVEAMLQATRENPGVIEAARERMAEVFARSYTDAELEALVASLTDPVGRAVHAKQVAALSGPPATFTPEEQAWVRDAEKAPLAKQLQEKKFMVSALLGMASIDVMEPISRRALEIYCAKNPCPAARRR